MLSQLEVEQEQAKGSPAGKPHRGQLGRLAGIVVGAVLFHRESQGQAMLRPPWKVGWRGNWRGLRSRGVPEANYTGAQSCG